MGDAGIDTKLSQSDQQKTTTVDSTWKTGIDYLIDSSDYAAKFGDNGVPA